MYSAPGAPCACAEEALLAAQMVGRKLRHVYLPMSKAVRVVCCMCHLRERIRRHVQSMAWYGHYAVMIGTNFVINRACHGDFERFSAAARQTYCEIYVALRAYMAAAYGMPAEMAEAVYQRLTPTARTRLAWYLPAILDRWRNSRAAR
jgi:hypothetical protein